jgi:hypothetical protein
MASRLIRGLSSSWLARSGSDSGWLSCWLSSGLWCGLRGGLRCGLRCGPRCGRLWCGLRCGSRCGLRSGLWCGLWGGLWGGRRAGITWADRSDSQARAEGRKILSRAVSVRADGAHTLGRAITQPRVGPQDATGRGHVTPNRVFAPAASVSTDVNRRTNNASRFSDFRQVESIAHHATVANTSCPSNQQARRAISSRSETLQVGIADWLLPSAET